MSEILTAALRLAELGLAVHWLRPPVGGKEVGRGKAPTQHGWQLLPCMTAEQLRRSYRSGLNVGIHTGLVAGARCPVVVVDCDSPEAILWAAKNLPKTPLRTRTAQGFHLYYRHPGHGPRIPNRVKVGKIAMEIRADEGNAVAAPSVHPSGYVYASRGTWTDEAVAQLPFFSREWFPTPAAPSTGAVRLAATPTITQARRVLAKMYPSVTGQGGDLHLWTAALMLATRFCLDEGSVADLLISDFNGRCCPPWPEARIRYKAAQAVRSRAAIAARAGHRS